MVRGFGGHFYFAMNRNEIVLQITQDKSYLEYCKKICQGRDVYQDLYQYTMLQVLEMEEEKLKKLFSEDIRKYIGRIIWLSVNTKSSEFYRKFIKEGGEDIPVPNIAEDETESEFDLFMDRFNSGLDRECNRCTQKGIYPTAAGIYEVYRLEGSITEASKKLNIPIPTIHRNIQFARSQALKYINEDTSSNTK